MAKKQTYTVLADFTDLQDKEKNGKNKVYRKDDTYPRPANKKISEERLAQLLSNDNNQKQPVIKEDE